jgi:hypothetical protein
MKKKDKKPKKLSRKQRKIAKERFKKFMMITGLAAYGIFLYKLYMLGEQFSDFTANMMKDMLSDNMKTANNSKTAN